MSELVLTGPLLDFGTSFWRSPLAMDEFPGLMAAGMTAIGRFGIGFFSIFMLGSEVRIYSRRCDRGVEDGRLLEFRDGASSRPILSPADPKDLPRDGGTRIEVKLSQPPDGKRGLLASRSYNKEPLDLGRVVAAVAPNLDVALCLKGEKSHPLVEPGDWLTMPEQTLLVRLDPMTELSGEGAENNESRLRTLAGADGQIYGRAAISPERYTTFFALSGGWITIAGLRANRTRNVQGVLLGEAVTAARDAANPLVDAETLARWASEQAQLISQTVDDEEIHAKAAEVVLECGGQIDDLKIVKWGADWLNSQELRERLGEVNSFDVSFDGEFEYDEDTDDVMPREFRNEFTQADDISIVLRHDGAILRNGAVAWPNALTGQPVCPDSRVAAHVRGIVKEVWGEGIEPDSETRTIGKVGWTDIERQIARYARFEELEG